MTASKKDLDVSFSGIGQRLLKEAEPDAPGTDAPAGTVTGGAYGTGFARKGGLADKLAPTFPHPPTAQQDINQILKPYMDELMNLGPEYGAEMAYLKPYLAGTPTTFSDVVAGSKADESPTGSKSMQAAEQAMSGAISAGPTPGFGNAAKAAQQFEGTIPYSALLQSVLEAGKNIVLGYSSTPQLKNINTQEWPTQLQGLIPYLETSMPTNTAASFMTGGVTAPGQQPQPKTPTVAPGVGGGGSPAGSDQSPTGTY